MGITKLRLRQLLHLFDVGHHGRQSGLMVLFPFKGVEELCEGEVWREEVHPREDDLGNRACDHHTLPLELLLELGTSASSFSTMPA